MNQVSTSTMKSIHTKEGISREEFIKNFLNPGIPLIIPGAMKEWSAHKKWDPTYFKDFHGEKLIKVNGEHIKMRDFMDTVLASDENKPSKYLNEVNIHKEFPELLNDIEPFQYYALPDMLMSKFMPESWGLRNGVVELLIAGKGTKFPTIHYDGFHMNTFITQIRGDKEFYLFSPDQTPYMYQLYPGSNKSAVNDVHEPDLDCFPLFAKAEYTKVIVKEGETIFLPTGWWHTTKLLSLSIAVSTNNIGSSQWGVFADDFSQALSQDKRKQQLYKYYLKMAGVAMDFTKKIS